MPGKLIIFSAPSGTGKSTIINWLMAHKELRLAFSISLSPMDMPTIMAAALPTPIIITVEICWTIPAMEFAATGSPAE